MSKTIDERVVSMQFDNRNFEANVKTSLSTLDKLKQKLNLTGATKGLENLGAAASKVNFSPLASGVETVSMKFSALEVMAVTALANITNQAINTGKQLVKSLSIDQLKTGWNKYEQKTASVQTIMNATGKSIDEVSAYLDKLMWYSDETSYGFTDMTQSLAQLTSAGGDIDKLIPMIEGIANATAFAGKGASEFSRAIYNLNQSYSAGALQYMDWKSLDLAGVSSKQLKQTFIDTAIALGKLDKEGRTAGGTLVEIGNFGQTLQEKWASTEVMEAAFGKFSQLTEAAYAAVNAGEFDTAAEAIEALAGDFDEVAVKSFKAAQEAKSFTEAIEATKDAVSSQWMKTYELIFGNKEEATKIWTELCNGLWEIFASGGESRNDLLKNALGSKWGEFTDQINKAGVSTEDFTEKLINLARKDEEAAKIFNNGVKYNSIGIDKLIEKYGSLEAVLASGELTNGENLIIRTLESFASSEAKVSGTTDDLTGKLEEFQKVVNGVIRGDFGSGLERMDALAEAGYDYDLVQGLVNKIWERNGKNWSDTTISVEELTEAISQLSDSELENIGYTEDQITTLRQLVDEAKKTGTPINDIIKKLQKPSGRELLIDSVRNALIGLKSILDTFKGAWVNVFNPGTSEERAEKLYNTIEKIHDFSTKLKPSAKTLDNLSRTFNGLLSVIGIFGDVLSAVGGVAFSLFSDVLGVANIDVLDFTANIGDNIVAFRQWLKDDNKLVKGIQFLGNKLENCVIKIKSWIDAFTEIEGIQNALSKINELFSGSFGSISEWFEGMPDVQNLAGYIIDGLINGLEYGVQAVWDAAIELGKGIIDGFCEFMGIHSPSKEMYVRGEDTVTGLANGIEDNADTIFDKARELGEKILDGIKDVLGIGGGESSEAKAVGEEASNGLLDGLFSKFENFDWSKVFSGVMAGGLLVAVIKLVNAISDIASMFDGIGEVLYSTAKVLTGISWQLKASAIKEITESILMLAGAVSVLSLLVYTGHLWEGIGALVAIIAIFSLVIFGLNKLSGKTDTSIKVSLELNKLALAMIGISSSLLMLTGVVALLGLMQSFGDGLMKMISLMTVIGTFIAICQTSLNEKDIAVVNRISGVIAKLSLAFTLMSGAVAIIGFLNAGSMTKAVSFAVGLLTFIHFLSKIAESSEDGIASIGNMALKMAAAMLLLSAVIKIAGTFTSPELVNSATFALGFLTFVTILVKIANYAEKEMPSIGKTLISMAASMLILSAVVKIAGKFTPNEMSNAATFALGFLTFVVILLGIANYAEKEIPKIATTLLAMSAAMAILAGLVIVLGIITPVNLLKGTAVLLALSIFMAGLILATQKAQDCKSNIMAMAVAIGIMGVAIAALSFIPWSNALVATGSMIAVMGMFSLMILSASKLKDANGILAPLIALSVAAGIIGGMIYLISNVTDYKKALAAAGALSLVMLTFSGSLWIISQAKDISALAVGALFNIAAAVGIIGLVLLELGKMQPENTIGSAVALGIISVALASAILILGKAEPQAILASQAMLVMSVALIAMAASLKILSTVPFESLISGAIALVVVIAVLAIGSSVMVGVGIGAGVLTAALIGLSVAVVIASAGLYIFAKALQIISDTLPSLSNGLVMLFTNVSNCKPQIDDFCNALISLGNAGMNVLVKIAIGLLTLSLGAVTFAGASVLLAGALIVLSVAVIALAGSFVLLGIGITSAIVLVGGAILLFAYLGQNLIGGFIEGINSMIGRVVETISGFVNGVIGTFKNLLGIHSPSLVMMAIGLFTGEGFAAGVDSSKGTVETSAAGLGDAFINGVKEKLGNNSFDLGGMFGQSFADGVDSSSGDASKSGENLIDNVINTFKNSDEKYENAGKGNIEKYVGGFTSAGESEFSLFDGEVKNVINGLKDKDPDFENAGIGNIQNWSSGTASGWAEGYDLSNMNLEQIQSLISGQNGTFSDLGLENMLGYDTGLSTGGSASQSTAGEVASSAAREMGNTRSQFYESGVFVAKGFMEGLRSQQSAIVSAARSMANASAIAVRNTLEVRSPSRVFYEIGSYAGQGLVNALRDYGDAASNAGSNLADNAMIGLKTSISRIKDIIESNIDAQPTIRPVIDLSDVNAGVGAINGLLNLNPSIGAMANVRAISSGMNSGQNGTTNDVISAINDLGRRIGKTSGDTYNINGVTYDDGSNVSNAVRTIVRAARIERRV